MRADRLRCGFGGFEEDMSVRIYIHAHGVAVFYMAGDDLFAQGRFYELTYGATQRASAEARVATFEGYTSDEGVREDQVDVLSLCDLAEVVEKEPAISASSSSLREWKTMISSTRFKNSGRK